jgi:demethylmenaquinone methyltransferase / 2-methoxy-6-polyprenyl-1,4-benzoquinol methylase
VPTSPPATESPSTRTEHARRLFSGLPRRYDLMAELLSFGENGRWRRFMVSRVAAPTGGRILDVATGTAGVALELVGRTSASVVGLDQSEPMLRTGIARVREAGRFQQRIRFVLGRGERLPFPDGCFDAVTFTYLLRYVDDPPATLAELTRVLRPGGSVANLEFHVPRNPLWRGLWFAYTRVGLPLAGRLASRSWYHVGRFLGPSISTFYRRHPLPAQLEMWRAAGIEDVRANVMSLGGGVVIWGTKATVEAP